jgi:alkylation response protein AidB-like acyl-CoA dehydrogenase
VNLDFTEEQQMLRTAARTFLISECPKKKVRELEESENGFDRDLWKKVAELGWIGLIIPEAYGGSGSDFVTLLVLFEEIGRNILPSPLFSTEVLGALPVVQHGSEAMKQSLLPRIARGQAIVALAILESSVAYEPTAMATRGQRRGSGYSVHGTKIFVSDARVADYFLVAARTARKGDPKSGVTLFLVDAKKLGVKVEVMPTIGLDNQCEVDFSNVAVSRDDVLGELGQGWEVIERVLDQAAILKCAESVGAMEAILDMTTSFSKERVQYGKTIASFQVIQHYLANMSARTLTAKAVTYRAAWMVKEGLPCTLQVSAAKAWVNEAYKFVTERAVQIHGAIGLTRDHDVGLYYRRAKAADVVFGDSDYHYERIARQLWPSSKPFSG